MKRGTRFEQSFGWVSPQERREADLFFAELIGAPGLGPAMRSRSRSGVLRAPSRALREDVGESVAEWFGEIVESCGFFGQSVRRTEAEVRQAVVQRAQAEWTAWHPGGTIRRENDTSMFGRLIGYYVAAIRSLLPTTLTAIQANALGTIDYAPLLSATSASTITAEVTRIRGLLLAGAPGATASGLPALIDSAIRHAQQANANAGDFSAWSAAWVSACVRGAAVTQGLEAVTTAGAHFGRDALLQPSLSHIVYALEAHRRRRARPVIRGTYHAFGPDERAPQVGDIIVQDRQATAPAQLLTFATMPSVSGRKTHGDIVVEVQPTFVITIGGNVGDSVRRRRFPRNDAGFLVVNARQLYTQEDNSGTLPPVPSETSSALHAHSTSRIFTLLSPIEECAAVPGQSVPGGVLV